MSASIAQNIKWNCETIARGGYCLTAGVIWQRTRVNARPFPIHPGRLLAERRCPKSGFQTDALHLYPDGSMLIVKRTVDTTTLTATKGESK
jgi:hypothetical protein